MIIFCLFGNSHSRGSAQPQQTEQPCQAALLGTTLSVPASSHQSCELYLWASLLYVDLFCVSVSKTRPKVLASSLYTTSADEWCHGSVPLVLDQGPAVTVACSPPRLPRSLLREGHLWLTTNACAEPLRRNGPPSVTLDARAKITGRTPNAYTVPGGDALKKKKSRDWQVRRKRRWLIVYPGPGTVNFPGIVTEAVAPKAHPCPSFWVSLEKTEINHILSLCLHRRKKRVQPHVNRVQAGSAPRVGRKLPCSSLASCYNSKISARLCRDGSTCFWRRCQRTQMPKDPTRAEKRWHPSSWRNPAFSQKTNM